jgi:diguanylate cyclase (GGDEF)-like protein
MTDRRRRLLAALVRRRPDPGTRVAAFILLLAAAAIATWVAHAASLAATPSSVRIPLPALALIFAATEIYVLHIQVRREAQTVSLSEIPLVLGLYFASPATLGCAWVLGPGLVFFLYRRQAPVKVAFNLALLLAQSVLSIEVFRALGGAASGPTPHTWPALFVAIAVSGAFAALATTLVIGLSEGSLRLRDLVREPFSALPMSLAVATVALSVTAALSYDFRLAIPVAGSLALLIVGYRAYASLAGRHLSLERLYRLSQAVTGSPEVDEVLTSVLAQAQEMLSAEQACVVFLPGSPQERALQATLQSGGSLLRTEVAGAEFAVAPWTRITDEGAPLLVPRGTRTPALRNLLAQQGVRDMIVVPLRGEAGVVGALWVGDRLGDVRSFDNTDVQLLETVANQAGIALQNGQLIDRLRHEALHDALTGLPNRAMLLERLARAVPECDPAAGDGLAVMLCDLDGFKQVNDTLGHAYGDLLLQEVGRRFASAAPEGATVARLGGDEFAVLIPHVPHEDFTRAAAAAISATLEEPLHVDGLDLEVGVSIGVAHADDCTDASALLRHADAAMYEAKRNSRSVELYRPDLEHGSSVARLSLVGALRSGLNSGQLALHVQPQVSLRTGEITGVEALARWRRPDGTLLPPDEFIPVAERSGLIRPLTSRVLEGAIEAASIWSRGDDNLNVAVNLSTRNLLDTDLADEVDRLLRRYGLPAERLTLEITESGVLTDPQRSMRVLQHLQDMGVTLSIDDFGTGYSSLSHLRRLPVSEVKIDKSFVFTMLESPDDDVIVRSIIDLARNLSRHAVAEGVEDIATWHRLRQLGCDSAQGFVIARPMPIEDFQDWLANWNDGRWEPAAS